MMVSTLHLALPLSQPLHSLDKLLVSPGFLFASWKIGIIILATNGNGLIGMLHAFVWGLAYSWHEMIINNIPNTSANVLRDLQKNQHPQILNIWTGRKHPEVIKGWHHFIKQWSLMACLSFANPLWSIFIEFTELHFVKQMQHPKLSWEPSYGFCDTLEAPFQQLRLSSKLLECASLSLGDSWNAMVSQSLTDSFACGPRAQWQKDAFLFFKMMMETLKINAFANSLPAIVGC